MTLAAGIEVGSGPVPSLGLGRTPGAARGMAQTGIQGLSPSIVPASSNGTVGGAENFRTGWQALMATFVPVAKSPGEAGTVKTQEDSQATPAAAKQGGDASRMALTSIAVLGLPVEPETAEGISSKSSEAASSQGDTEAERFVASRIVEAGEPVANKAEAKKLGTASESDAEGASPPAHSFKAAKAKALAEEVPAGTAPAAIEVLPQALPVPPTTNPTVSGYEIREQPVRTGTTQADLTVAQPSYCDLASLTPSPLAPVRFDKTVNADGAARMETSEDKNSIRQGEASPPLGPSPLPSPSPVSSPLPLLSPSETSTLAAGADNLPAAQAASGLQAAASTEGPSSYTAPASSQEPILTAAVSCDSTQSAIASGGSSQESTHRAPAASLGPAQGPKPSQEPSQDLSLSLASGEEKGSASAPVADAVQSTTPSRDSSPTSLPIGKSVWTEDRETTRVEHVSVKPISSEEPVSTPEKIGTAPSVAEPMRAAASGEESYEIALPSQEMATAQAELPASVPAVAPSRELLQDSDFAEEKTPIAVAAPETSRAVVLDRSLSQAVPQKPGAVSAQAEEPASVPAVMPNRELLQDFDIGQRKTSIAVASPGRNQAVAPDRGVSLIVAQNQGPASAPVEEPVSVSPVTPNREPLQDSDPAGVETSTAVAAPETSQAVAPDRAFSQAVPQSWGPPSAQEPVLEQALPDALTQDTAREAVFTPEKTQALPQSGVPIQVEAPRRESTQGVRVVEPENPAPRPLESVKTAQAAAPSQEPLQRPEAESISGFVSGPASGLSSGAIGSQESTVDLNLAQTAGPGLPQVMPPARNDDLQPAANLSHSLLGVTPPDPAEPAVASQREAPAPLPNLNSSPTAHPRLETARRNVPSSTEIYAVESNPEQPAHAASPGPSLPRLAKLPSPIASEIPASGQALIPAIPLAPASSPSAVEGNEDLPKAAATPVASHASAAVGSDAAVRLPAAVDTASQAPAPANAIAASQAAPVPVMAGRSGSAGGARSSTPETLRPARGAGRSDLARHGSPLAPVQPAIAFAEVPAMVAGVAGVRGAVSLAGGVAAASTTATTVPEPGEIFEALDSQSEIGRPAWIHAGGQRVEAGFEDPALGWVGVRAESGGGRVHAEVVSGSTDAAQALSGHLAGLNAYLAERHTQVETLTVTAPESRSASSASERGGGEQMQQGAGQQTGQGAGTGSSPSLSSSSAAPAATEPGTPASQGEAAPNAEADGRGGTHISVMA